MAACWYGFEHPYEDVTYQFAIGTTPGTDDVTGFMDIGSVTEHTQSGLSLALQQVGLYKLCKATLCECGIFFKENLNKMTRRYTKKGHR